MNAEQHLGWLDVEYDQHGVWLMRYIADMLMDQQQIPEQDRADNSIRSHFTMDALDLLAEQAEEIRAKAKVHLDLEALDLDRMDWPSPKFEGPITP